MDKEPKQDMIPAEKALSYIWVRYVLMYVHPFFAGCGVFLIDVLWYGWTKDSYPKVSLWIIFFLLCFFIAAGIVVGLYHARAWHFLTKNSDHHIDGKWGIAVMAFGWGIWYWLIVGPTFWPSIFPYWDFYTRDFIQQ